jgi:hypothetical protein
MRSRSRPVWCLAIAMSLTALAPATASSRGHTVRGVVVHRSPVLHRYTLVVDGRLQTVETEQGQPAVGRRVTVRISRGATAHRQLGFRNGPRVGAVTFRGVASVVDAGASRFVVSDGFSSILIRDRRGSPLPGLRHRIRLRVRFGRGGRLIEDRLSDLGFRRDPLRVTGLLRYLVLPNEASVVTPTSTFEDTTCRPGCLVVSGDDARESDDRELLVVPITTVTRVTLVRRAGPRQIDDAVPVAVSATVANPAPPTPSQETPIAVTGAITVPPVAPPAGATSPPAPARWVLGDGEFWCQVPDGTYQYVDAPRDCAGLRCPPDFLNVVPSLAYCPVTTPAGPYLCPGSNEMQPSLADCPVARSCPPGDVLAPDGAGCCPQQSVAACEQAVVPPPSPRTPPAPLPVPPDPSAPQNPAVPVSPSIYYSCPPAAVAAYGPWKAKFDALIDPLIAADKPWARVPAVVALLRANPESGADCSWVSGAGETPASGTSTAP